MAAGLNELTCHLNTVLAKELPGEEDFFKFGNYTRAERLKQIPKDGSARLSATLLLLYEKEAVPHFVLIERRKYPGVHSGQISFPGGKKEDSDADLDQTALRETHEEVGIAPSQVTLLGSLTEVYIPPSNFLVYPKVGIASGALGFTPEPSEVESIVEVPIPLLLDSNHQKLGKVNVGEGNFSMKVPYFDVHGHMVWGATAIILSEFRALISSVNR